MDNHERFIFSKLPDELIHMIVWDYLRVISYHNGKWVNQLKPERYKALNDLYNSGSYYFSVYSSASIITTPKIHIYHGIYENYKRVRIGYKRDNDKHIRRFDETLIIRDDGNIYTYVDYVH